MNSLNDFIEIFGLNINEGDIIKDKQGIEYKLSHIHTEKLDDHENDDLYKEGLGINGDSFELEHTFNEKDILKDDGIQYVKLDAVYEKDIIEIDGIKYLTLDTIYELEEYYEFNGIKYIPLAAVTDPAGLGEEVPVENEDDEEFDAPHICAPPREVGHLVFETEEDTLAVELYLSHKSDCTHQ